MFAILFGICWTVMAYSLTRDAPFPLAGVVFPLFGVLFVLLGVAQLIFNLKNTVSKDRFTLLDIADADSEIDPLERAFGAQQREGITSIEARLRKLDELKNKGLINSSEYAAKRKSLLDEM